MTRPWMCPSCTAGAHYCAVTYPGDALIICDCWDTNPIHGATPPTSDRIPVALFLTLATMTAVVIAVFFFATFTHHFA